MLSLRKRLLVCVLSLLLAACGGVPLRTGGTGMQPGQDAKARALLAEGKYTDAAEEYARLAANAAPPAAQQYRLKAAAALLDGHQIAAASKLLEEHLAGTLPAKLRLGRDVLEARIALAEHDPQHALALLPAGVEATVPAAMARLIHQLRIAAYTATGQYLAAARERLALEPLLGSDSEVQANRQALWEDVSRLSPAQIMNAQSSAPELLGGWLALAAVAKQSVTDSAALQSGLAAWRKSFPGHPAETSIVPELLHLAQMSSTMPTSVALLLPFSGAFADAAVAIRDGFLAAWYEDDSGGTRPVVHVWNTSGADIHAVVRKAVAAGANFIVGPLDKASVNALATQGGQPVPTLALNYADTTATAGAGADGTNPGPPAGAAPPATGTGDAATPATAPDTAVAAPAQGASPATASASNAGAASSAPATGGTAPLYQFALSPESEARAVAERAWFDGLARAAVLTPASPFGERVARAFIQRWEELGGIVVARQTYPDDARDLSEPVKELLNIDQSEQRYRELRQIIGGGLKHEARRRHDMDFIFITGSPVQARLIKPQLRFHDAGDVPVYATSHVYGGVVNASADGDLDGVIFGDMPWVLPDAGRDLALRREIAAAWPDSMPAYGRLYAFGVDAYRLIPHLGRLKAQPYSELPGATGGLSVDENGRVHRRLTWAHFVDGVPRLLDTNQALP